MIDDLKFFANGVVSDDGQVICLEFSESRLQCVDLSTGNIVCTVPGEGLRPLCLANQKLFGWRPHFAELHVVTPFVADVSDTTAKVVHLPQLELPSWIDVQSKDPAEFSVDSRVSGQELILQWRARSEYRGGASAPQSVIDESRKSVCGKAVIDIESRELLRSEIESGKTLDQESDLAGMLYPPEGLHRVPYRMRMTIKSDPWNVDGIAMALWPNDSGTNCGLRLVSSPLAAANKADIPQILFEANFDRARNEVLVSSNGRQIFVSQGDRWKVFDERGKLRGSILRDDGTLDMACIGDRVIYIADKVQPDEEGTRRKRTLAARDFESSELLWTVPVFDRPDLPAPPRAPKSW